MRVCRTPSRLKRSLRIDGAGRRCGWGGLLAIWRKMNASNRYALRGTVEKTGYFSGYQLKALGLDPLKNKGLVVLCS
jgi:hypothetical protein